MENKIILMPLNKWNFVFVHLCLTLGLPYLFATTHAQLTIVQPYLPGGTNVQYVGLHNSFGQRYSPSQTAAWSIC